MTEVYIEKGTKRVFACALDWPGWCRTAKTEEAALEALAATATRYAVFARQAKVPFNPATAATFKVVERLPGTMTTDFGAPDAQAKADRTRLAGKEAEQIASLLDAAWVVFDRVVKKAPASLRKGPRGGGRDRDEIVEHVAGAEDAFARKIGVRVKDTASRRAALLELLRGGTGPLANAEKGWPRRYAARRIAWHVIDHTWEIEDRSE